ncbi:MAG: hypothetical protein ACQEQF_00130 [Bacillota bacterium]
MNKLEQIKVIVDKMEDKYSKNSKKDIVNATQEKAEKAMAYEQIREIVK